MTVDSLTRKDIISDEERKVLDLFRQAKAQRHAEIVIQIQDGKAVSAKLNKKYNFR